MITSVEVEERHNMAGVWTVEAIGAEGEIYQALFAGPDAESRAYEYARLRYGVTDQPERRRSSRKSAA